MRRIMWILIIVLAVGGVVIGGYLLWDRLSRVSASELEQIVRREGVPFEAGSIPEEVIERLGTNRVVVVGELHFLREHRELIADLLRELHAQGFRQYLFEWSQAADWLLNDYVNDGGLMPEWKPPHDIGGEAITAIRDFNRTLPEDERIQVRPIDVHLADYGGRESWLAMLDLTAQQLPDPGPIPAFLENDHESDESHRAELESLQAELEAGRSALTASWGDYWYDTVVEMVEVELRSAEVRAIRESDYDESVRLREEAIKWIADRRIEASSGGTLVNMGSTHAQKKGLWGTEGIEWLGDYLVHKSPAAGGSVIVLDVAAARITELPGSGNTDFDLAGSPENELFRVMNESWPDQVVFLPVDDPLFEGARVPINASGDVFVSAPKQHFDAFLLLPSAQRDFVGD